MTLANHVALCKGHRACREPLPTGSAPHTSSHNFKIRQPGLRRNARRWDHLLSLESLNHKASPLKSASRTNRIDMISLGTARPAAQYYPWQSIVMHCLDSIPDEEETQSAVTSMACTKHETGYDLSVAMNYGYAAGSPQMLRFVTEHVEMIHKPPYEDWECCLSCGSTSAMEIALRVFCDPAQTVLVEKYTYTGTIAAIRAQGLNALGVEMDDLGLIPMDLEHKLDNWDDTHGKKPSVLYTIPTGQNPTGTTQSTDRRKDTYQIAKKHDLYIIEDDPYYLLQLADSRPSSKWPEGSQRGDDYIRSLLPSYLSLDVDGRVLRMDSTSKILAPGLRCGWVTGCSQIIEKFIAYSEVGVSSPSGPSQIMLYKLLDETWGHDGFVNWLDTLSQQYCRRRDVLIQGCENYLPSDICQWQVPNQGMFLWVIVDVSKHPAIENATDTVHREDICLHVEDQIYRKSQENGVLVSKGSWFIFDERLIDEVSFRLTFAAAPEEDLVQAIIGFASAIRSEFRSG